MNSASLCLMLKAFINEIDLHWKGQLWLLPQSFVLSDLLQFFALTHFSRENHSKCSVNSTAYTGLYLEKGKWGPVGFFQKTPMEAKNQRWNWQPRYFYIWKWSQTDPVESQQHIFFSTFCHLLAGYCRALLKGWVDRKWILDRVSNNAKVSTWEGLVSSNVIVREVHFFWLFCV